MSSQPIGLLSDTLDQEWIELIKEAYRLGLTVEEIRSFLEQAQNGA